MKPRIELLKEKKLVGYNLKMSLTQNKTGQFWVQFGPQIKEITNSVSEDKISLQIYPPLYHHQFDLQKEFEKWATVEVKDFAKIPNGMKSFILKEGLYAVSYYRGLSADNAIYQYVFGEWLQNSPYQMDDRPHFEVLGEKYKNNDPNSEEEIWIPVKERNIKSASL